MPETRSIEFVEALNEAIDFKLADDPSVFVLGEGANDPKGIFGSTSGLAEKFGDERVMEMPVSEAGMTGIAIGAAISGMRPVMTHQRVDFMLLSLDQLVNNAAKLRYIFGESISVPLVVRAVIGRGWGQSAQHAQSLETLFAHIPGLKVVMPSNAYDAKGMLIAAIEDDNPVIFLEHRWLHGAVSEVPAEPYRCALSGSRIAAPGTDVTIAATGLMVIEALRARDALAMAGVSAEILDLHVLRPLDTSVVEASVRKTGRLLCVDTGWREYGVGSEITASVAEECFEALEAPPRRLATASHPVPASVSLIENYYPDAFRIGEVVGDFFDLADTDRKSVEEALGERNNGLPLDVPDPSFKGPF